MHSGATEQRHMTKLKERDEKRDISRGVHIMNISSYRIS